MVLCSLRMFNITGEAQYLKLAETHYNYVWERGYDTISGGGLYWSINRANKNACINAPAVVAAVKLFHITGNNTYLIQASALYMWTRNTLWVQGRVNDHIDIHSPSPPFPLDDRTFTYNAGAFIGAAYSLHLATGDRTLLADVISTVTYAKAHLTGEHGVPFILNDECLPGNDDSPGILTVCVTNAYSSWCFGALPYPVHT
jgi:predicted alpha-1,6-mannanase (GH76 family)